MKRDFLINITFLLAINLLVKPVYIFGIDMGVQNRVGEIDYGIYFNLFNFAFLWQIINDFGIQNYNSRTVSQEEQSLSRNFYRLLAFKSVLALLFAGIVIAAALLSGYQAYLFPFLTFIVVNHILSSLILFLRSNVSGLGYYRTDSFFSSLDRFLLILVVGYLLYVSDQVFQIEWFIYAQTITLFITALSIFFWLRSRVSLSGKWSSDWSWVMPMLKETYPYALVVFLMTLYTRLDVFMIEQLRPDGLEQVATYAAGYRLLDAFNMFGFLFATLLLPMFSRMLAAKESVSELLFTAWQLVWAGAIPLAVGAFLFRDSIMTVLYTDADTAYAEVMGMLILNFIAMSGTYIFGTLLTARGELRVMNILFAISIVANVVLNVLLIPEYGAIGAAYTTLFTQGLAFVAQIYLSRWAFSASSLFRVSGKFLIYTVLVVLSFLGWQTIDFSGWGEYGPLFGVVGGCLTALPIAMVCGLLDWRSAKQLLRRKFSND